MVCSPLAGAVAGGVGLPGRGPRSAITACCSTRGDAALRDDQTFAAIEAYSGAIALRPDSMLAYLRRGETYQRRGDRGDLERARDFRTAAALDPTATRPLEALGDVAVPAAALRPRRGGLRAVPAARRSLGRASTTSSALARYRDRRHRRRARRA